MFLAFAVYIFLLVAFCFSGYFSENIYYSNQSIQKNQKGFVLWNSPMILTFVVMLLLIGLRYNVGVDYLGYEIDYLNYGNGKNVSFEIGFKYIIAFLNYLELGPWSMFMVSAGLIMFFFISAFKDFPYLLKWGLFFCFTTGFFFATMNGLRQTIALMIFFNAVRSIISQSVLKFHFLIILGLCFHLSILLVYPFYFFIHRISFTDKRWLIVYFGAYITSYLIGLKGLILFFINLVPQYAQYALVITENYEKPKAAGFGNYYNVLIGAFIIFFSRELVKKMPYLKVYYNFFFIGGIFFNLFWLNSVMGRLTYLFIWFKVFCLAGMMYLLGKSKWSALLYLIILGEIVLFLYRILAHGSLCSPFQFIELE